MSVRSDLRGRLNSGEQIVAPGAYDPISARLVQSLGFDTIYCGGYISGAHLAVTEPLMTMTEQLSVAERVVKSVPLPVICDADAGYGDPVHAMHTVRSFEAAGIAGIHIEDQFFPKRASYHAGLEHVIPMEDFLQKMRYALQARIDPDFLIVGRTDAFTAVEGDMDEAIRRGNALRDLGVDLVMPRGVRQREDLATFRRGVPDVPLMVIAGADDITVQEYQELGLPVRHLRHVGDHRRRRRLPAYLPEPEGHRPHRHQRAAGGVDARRSGGADQPPGIPASRGRDHGAGISGPATTLRPVYPPRPAGTVQTSSTILR